MDLLVAGGGAAGLTAALTAAEAGARVAVVGPASPRGASSWHAQGGIAAVLDPDDRVELHVADTLACGRGLCRESAVRVLCEEAPAAVGRLVGYGIGFDEGLGLEGGHSRARIVHANGAATGAVVTAGLAARAHGRVRRVDGSVSALLVHGGRCVGAVAGGRRIAARAVVLATGGAAARWARTTNPAGARGHGLELARAAGAALADLELVQFHPTAVAGGTSALLLSEALRGAGARLLDGEGRRFVDELAPRDVVARAVAAVPGACLDVRPVDRSRFPTLVRALEERGYDPGREPIPVEPAAHYTVGGVVTDVDGRTEVPGLYAAGECAATGVHGANRLASNSLLECLVFGRRAALAALDEPAPAGGDAAVALAPPAEAGDDAALLWREAGLVRDAAGLERLRTATSGLSRLVAESALARAESRGCHFRADLPHEDPALAAHVVLRPGREPVFERWS